MDKTKEASIVINAILEYKNNSIPIEHLIKKVCKFFDDMKNETFSSSDLQFLKYIACYSGIPQFYDMLEKFNSKTEITNISLNTFSSLCYESSLHTDENNKVHKYQKEILDLYSIQKFENRYLLSASTSFGKTYLVYEIIKKMKYSNVLLIYPAVALLSENLEKIINDINYKDYKLHTLSEVKKDNFGEKNIFIYTPERFLSFIDNNYDICFDFVFVDEVYKIDNEYILDEQIRENERDVSYRLAIYNMLKKCKDILLTGPYIKLPEKNSKNLSFYNFLQDNKIKVLDYNNYEIVNKKLFDSKLSKQIELSDSLKVQFSSQNKADKLTNILAKLLSMDENAIVYCSSRSAVEKYAKNIINSCILTSHKSIEYKIFLEHLYSSFKREWVVIKALEQGIGIHHGLIPKYIQKEIIKLFNFGFLRVLISTTTITEGVNTSAKNLIVLHDKKGRKPLKTFDAKNIAGRAGRFLYHYSGRVIIVQNDFKKIIEANQETIQHKNYSAESIKDDIDLLQTKNQYLNLKDKQRIVDMKNKQKEREIPDSILEKYKVVGWNDKMEIYDTIKKFDSNHLQLISKLIKQINFSKINIDFEGFQLIINSIKPIIKNESVNFLIDEKPDGQTSLLTLFVFYYLRDGFLGMVEYKCTQKNETIDHAMRETANFVYNILKYHVVKYLGVFNLMYKFYVSEQKNKKFEDVQGIDKLLSKMEYNAVTDSGRIASDFGVPFNVVNYYEGVYTSKQFDKYEQYSFQKIDSIITPKK